MARRGWSVTLGPERCHVFESQMATEPAGAHRIFSSGRSPPDQTGFFRVRWLPGMTRVAPLSGVKSSSIQAFWVVSGNIEVLRESVVQNGDGVVLAGDVDAGDHLFSSGHIDSMSGIALLTFIEERYGVEIEDLELVEPLNTLRALAQRIDELQPSRSPAQKSA